MLEILFKGGWMMVPLMVFSVLAVAVTLDRTIAFLAHRALDNRSLRARVLELVERGKIDEAEVLCGKTPGPVSAVLMVGLRSYRKHRALAKKAESITQVMKDAMNDYALHALSAVEKRLNVLSTIGNAAPLLGMCGTVLGMIKSFSSLAVEAGTAGGGGAVALGIAEALITTAAGLIIALIAVIPYNIFTSKADRIDLEISEAASELLDFVATRVSAES